MFKFFAAATAATLVAVAPASATVVVSIEAPGVTSTSANGGPFSVQSFDTASAGFQTGFTDTVGAVTFTYAGIDVRPADQFGGVGGSQYAATYNGLNFPPYDASAGSYTLGVTSTGGPINYFGAYFSAQDSNNRLTFLRNGNTLAVFTPAVVVAATAGTPAYTQGGLLNVFVNFYFTGGQTYDAILFEAAGNGTGFESDNHTVGSFVPPIPPTIIDSIPEPGTWAMLIVGFGMVGVAARRRTTVTA